MRKCEPYTGSVSQKRLYNLREAGVYLGRTEWAIRHLVWSGAIQAVKLGRRIQLDVRDMDEFIEDCKVREESLRH